MGRTFLLHRPGPVAALFALAVLLVRATSLDGAQLLQNGGFEAGSTSWGPSVGFSTSDCAPRSGSGAGRLAASQGGGVFVQQTNVGPFAAGPVTLTGYVRSASGTAGLRTAVMAIDSAGLATLIGFDESLAPPAYELFTTTGPVPAGAASLVVRLSLVGGTPAALCLDDITLDGPALATPTATVTPSPSATLPPSATASASPTPTVTATATPTRVASATATSVPAGAPSLAFENGGFEDSLDGWQKFGGELVATDEARRSGSGAAVLVSSTTSTKWAYQIVRVDAGQALTFEGFVLAGAGVERAYLRISWYATAGGEGTAIATDDSTASATPGSGFVHLTTGPRVPPPGTRSARLRVMLEPAGGGEARLYLDDFAVSTGPLPATPTAVPAVVPPAQPVAAAVSATAAPQAATPVATLTPGATTAATASPRPAPSPSPAVAPGTATPQPSTAVRAFVPATVVPVVAGEAAERLPAAQDGSFPWSAVAVPLFLGAAAAAYRLARRRA